jgi:CTP synthase
VGLICLFIFCQALLHALVALDRKLVVDWVPSCDLEDSTAEEVSFIYALSILLLYILEN